MEEDLLLAEFCDRKEENKAHSSARLDEEPIVDGLKQWEPLEVLPDTAATAALAQLTLIPDTSRRKISLCGVPKNLLVWEDRRIHRSTSLEWSEKLFKDRSKMRACSEIDHNTPEPQVRELKMKMEEVAQELKKNNMGRLASVDEKENDNFETARESFELPGDQKLGASDDARGSSSSSDREMRFSNKKPKLGFCVNPPDNWLFDECETSQEFEIKWEAISTALLRQKGTAVKKSTSTQNSSGRRHSIDRIRGLVYLSEGVLRTVVQSSIAKITMQTAQYFLNKIKRKNG